MKAPRKVRAPRTSFTSPGGRVFTIASGSRVHERWGPESTWLISYNGKPAGWLARDSRYAAPLEWHASTRQLLWDAAMDAPVGIGFDVAAFETVEACLEAWGRSADQILDWSEGKTVHTLYGIARKVHREGRA